ncbi:uncharacterized protein LOC107612484 [Arachis ipaensis]|uniref:uncharacterized protein LOC107612484 n=1 Tax=Arachis ipaensis TaxID=130454 RepID=UPI0007AF14B7|nr:uncharacterized protein LOC107612484 [Arachis ipaensis]XP_025628659.1 uncharacterized protein LOC112721849 [Arachis hypogaea]
MAWYCPEKKKYEAGRAQQPSRVFTTSATGVEGSETLIRGNYKIVGKILNVLFDSGVTHSLTAFEKASELGLKMVVLSYDLKVHNATSEAVVTRLGCPQVSFRVKQRDFVHDLICLSMTGFDLILGLDWLSKNCVLLNCSERTLHFMSKGGCECEDVVLLIANMSGEGQRLEQILVVCEFPEVFPKDIPDFPTAQEIEFQLSRYLDPGQSRLLLIECRHWN